MFVASFVCAILFGLTETAIPWLMYVLFDQERLQPFFTAEQIPLVLPALLITIFLVRGIVGFARIYVNKWLEQTMGRAIRQEMLQNMLSLPKSYHDKESSGVLIARVMQFVEQMFSNLTTAIVIVFQDSARIIGFLTTMFYLNWKYTLVVLVVIPFTILVIAIFSKRIRRFAGHEATEKSILTSTINDVIQGQTVVKTYGGKDRELNRLQNHLDKVRGMGLRQGVAAAINIPFSQLLVACSLAIIISLLSRDLVAGTMTEGEVSAFVFAMTLIPLSLRNLAGLANSMQQSLAAAEKVFHLIDATPETSTGTHTSDKVNGKIEFKNVRFKYLQDHDEYILNNLNLIIQPGETVALVGLSGSGKTTISNLIMNLYPVTQGNILIDDVELKDWSITNLRKHLALVSQDVIIFNTNIAENVAYPHVNEEINQEKLNQALQSAQIYDYVQSLPDKVNTILGERGIRLSGGERQRISLARVFYRDAPILIMDEATSSLDSQTEEEIKESLKKILQERTTIVIAHRFATVEIADRVLVINQGEIIANGTHSELMNTSSLYKRLYEAQQLEN